MPALTEKENNLKILPDHHCSICYQSNKPYEFRLSKRDVALCKVCVGAITKQFLGYLKS